MMRTLFLQAPSFDGFDGGAGARYQMRREIQSYWYPTWLAQPAALVEGSKLVDAPPHRLKFSDIVPEAVSRDLVVMHTSTPSFCADVRTAEALKALKPSLKIGMIGAKVAVEPDATLKASSAIDFVARNEFDFTIKEVAEGRDLGRIAGLSWRNGDGVVVHNEDRAVLERVAKRRGTTIEKLSEIWQAQAHWPALIEANLHESAQAFMQIARLPMLTKQAMHVAVSMSNACDF